MAGHNQNRTAGVSDNVFRCAPDQHVLKPGNAMRGGNNYVGILIDCFCANLVTGMPDLERRRYLNASPIRLPDQF